jgi:hypothetical protein
MFVALAMSLIIGYLFATNYATDNTDQTNQNKRHSRNCKGVGVEKKNKPVLNSDKSAFAWNGKITAYTSQERQTDSTPCTPAIHMNICREHDVRKRQNPQKDFFFCAAPQHDGMGANGMQIPFDTILHVEGLGRCKVVDRLSERAKPNQLDLYFGRADQTHKAIEFGVKHRTVSVVKWGSREGAQPDELYVHLQKY